MDKKELEKKLNKEYKEIGEITIDEISKSTFSPKDINYIDSIMEEVEPLESDEPIVVGNDWRGTKLIDGYHRLKNSIVNNEDIEAIVLEEYRINRKDDTLLEFMKSIVGKTVYFYDDYTFELDGKLHYIKPNKGCGGCGNGWSDLDVLDKFIGKKVKIKDVESKDKDDGWYDDLYDLYINGELFAEVDTGWGNGYYGGDFEIVR